MAASCLSGGALTGLRDEEEKHDDGCGDRDDAAGERPLVEVLVHLGVRVKPLEPLQERLHPLPAPVRRTAARSRTLSPLRRDPSLTNATRLRCGGV
jgi:hypothetical protein